MAKLAAAPVELSESEREELEKLARRPSTTQREALRAKIVLRAAAGESNGEIARGLEVSLRTVRRWRERWRAAVEPECAARARLQDAPRPGSPGHFSLEQITQLYAMACDPPEKYGRPLSHWTARELADEMVKQGFVESISARHVGRLLEEAELKPHQSRHWMHPPPTLSLP